MGYTKILTAIGLILVLLFLIFVWPTAYRYDDFKGLPIRINRFTGTVEVLYISSGWTTIKKDKK
jgi:hypothetical protein